MVLRGTTPELLPRHGRDIQFGPTLAPHSQKEKVDMTVHRQKRRRGQGALRQWHFLLALIIVAGGVLSGCDLLGEGDETQETIYPIYADENGNGVNDYVEASSHDAGTSKTAHPADPDSMPMGPAPGGHAFVDNNGDGICDYAQNGSATWHGPGFVDENGNGISDYWDEASPRHHQHGGMRFQDHNKNRINDHFEEETHHGPGHAFVDENGDGICDRAQDGSPTWHGPNFVDENGDGRCDYWEPGGRGHGGGHGGGPGMGGGP